MHAAQDIAEAYKISDKAARYEKIKAHSEAVVASLCDEDDDTKPSSDEVKKIFHDIEQRTVRENILNGNPRIDGRDTERFVLFI